MGYDTNAYHEKETNITSQIQQSDWERPISEESLSGQEQQDAINSLGNDGVEHKVDLDEVKDGNSFKRMAAKALDSVVPGEGSQASISISGTLPLYKNIGVSVDFIPSLELKAHRLRGKLRASVSTSITFKATAGTEGGWWPKFMAYFKASFQGSLLIIGDDATEIFNEFMLALSHVAESACDACEAPDNVKDALVNGIMDESARTSTIRGMDKADSVSLALGGSAEAGFDTSLGSGSVGASYTNTQRLGRKEGTDDIEVKTTNDVAGQIGFTFSAKKLGASIPAKASISYRDGNLRSLAFSVGINKTMKWDDFAPEIMLGTDWLLDVVNGISNGIDYLNRGLGNRDLSMLTSTVSNLSMADEAIAYTVFGNTLKDAAGNTALGSLNFGKTISFGIDISMGWNAWLGHNVSVTLSSTDSSSINGGALSVNIKKADQILSFINGTKKDAYFGS